MSQSDNSEKVILVIDDDAGIRQALEEILEGKGYLVIGASNGREGLSVLTQAYVDLVITDIFMPSMDGLEFIRAVRKDNKELKILAISGGGQMKLLESLEWAKAFGAARILKKPFSHQELLQTVAEMVNDSKPEEQ